MLAKTREEKLRDLAFAKKEIGELEAQIEVMESKGEVIPGPITKKRARLIKEISELES